MNNDLDHLMNPKWMKDIHRLNEKIKSMTINYYDLSKMQAIQQAIKPISALNALQHNELSKIATLLANLDSTSSLLTNQSTAMKAINVVMEANRLSSLALQESEKFRKLTEIMGASQMAIMAIQDSPTYKSSIAIGDALKAFPDIGEAFKAISIQDPTIMQAFNLFNDLPSLKKLTNLENSPFSDFDFSALVLRDQEYTCHESTKDFLQEIDKEIAEDVAANTNFLGLSEKSKRLILLLLVLIFESCKELILDWYSEDIRVFLVEIREELKKISTESEVRNYARSSYPSVDPKILNGYRIVARNNLNLRDGPGMNTQVMRLLPLGTLVEVIDKSNRAWLFVEVKIDGEAEQGWIARRYTAYFK